METKTDDKAKSSRPNSNDHWGQMNQKFNDFFTESLPEPVDHHKRNEKN